MVRPLPSQKAVQEPLRTPPGAASRALATIATADDLHGFVESPARRLQQELAFTLAQPEGRWSARRTLAFVVLSNGLFWAALVLTIRAMT